MAFCDTLDAGEQAKATRGKAATDQESEILIGGDETPCLLNALNQNRTRSLKHAQQSISFLKNTLPSNL